MKLLSLDYLSRRFGNKLPKSGQVAQTATQIGTQADALRVPGLPAAPVASALDETKITEAADSVEAWFIRQIPVFAEAEAEQLPLDLKSALADICFDGLFGVDVKANEDRERAKQGKTMILSVAPSYAGARIDQATGEVIMNPDACLVNIQGAWN